MSAANSNSDLSALFDAHIAREFADFDVNATMETMAAEPYVHCVATLAGGLRRLGSPSLLQRALHKPNP